jgi:Ulp1 family protease
MFETHIEEHLLPAERTLGLVVEQLHTRAGTPSSGTCFCKKRCHLFNSFFITSLLNEGSYDPNVEGVYDYEQVRKWGDKVPGGDVFKLEKIFILINVRACHWVCAVMFMQEKRIKIYDSLGPGSTHHLCTLFRYYLQDEHQAKSGQPLPLSEEWRLEQSISNVPRQKNGKPLWAELVPGVA